MIRFKVSLLVIFASLTFVFITSCNLKKEEPIVFDKSYPLALSPDVEWAVVTEPYAAYKAELSWTVSGNKHCRKGEILQIKGKSMDSNNENWFLFDDGWLPEDCLKVFDNRYKAEAYAKKNQ